MVEVLGEFVLIIMSIKTFVEAATFFHESGKFDVALALACAAVDATSAKISPGTKGNAKRNKDFLSRNMSTITEYGFPGLMASAIKIKCVGVKELKPDNNGYVGIEDIIYHIVRCSLLHQCEIDQRIVFTEHSEIADFVGTFRIPKQLICGLLEAVRREKCNAIEFS
jgi:hypothetical protein